MEIITMSIRSKCYSLAKVLPIIGTVTVMWMVYWDSPPITPLTDSQAWPAVTSNESCDVYPIVSPTVEYTGPVCEDCKDGVPVGDDGLYIPYNSNLHKYSPKGGSGIDYIGPPCDYAIDGRGNTVPESETLLNVILGGFIMMCIRRRYNG